MSAVARDVLKIVKEPDVEIDALAMLEWSRSQDADRRPCRTARRRAESNSPRRSAPGWRAAPADWPDH